MMRRISIQILGFPSSALFLISENSNKQLVKVENEDNLKGYFMQNKTKNLIITNNKTGKDINNTKNISYNQKSNTNTHNNLKQETSYLNENNLNYLNKLNRNNIKKSNRNKIDISSNDKNDFDLSNNDELMHNQDNILFYGDCLIDLIDFIGLIIENDLNDTHIESPKISPKLSIKVFSPYMNRKKSTEVNLLRKTSLIGLSRFALNSYEKESSTQISKINDRRFSLKKRDQEKNIINEDLEINNNFTPDKSYISSSDSFSEESEKEDKERENKMSKNKIKPIFELKQCIKEETENENSIHYIKDKPSSFDKTPKKVTDDTAIQNETTLNNYLLDITSNKIKINNENMAFFKEIYKILHNYFNNNEKSNDSMGPSFNLDVSKEGNIINLPINNILKYDNLNTNNKIDKSLNNFLIENSKENEKFSIPMNQSSQFCKEDKYENDFESIFKNNLNCNNKEIEELLDLIKRKLISKDHEFLSHNIDDKNKFVSIDKHIFNLDLKDNYAESLNENLI